MPPPRSSPEMNYGEVEKAMPEREVRPSDTSAYKSQPSVLIADEAKAFVAYVQQIDRLTQVAEFGIRALPSTPELLKSYSSSQHGGAPHPEVSEILPLIQSVADLASQEASENFPLLHGHAAVGIWSALEVALPRVAIGWLLDSPDSLRRPAFEKMKIPVSVMAEPSRELVMTFLIEELLANLTSSQIGIGRYESLLGAIGLGGSVEAGVRRDLLELSQARNVIVHRLGVVDKRFCQACPWLDLKVGDRLAITRATFVRFRDAALAYMTEVLWRSVEAYGGKRSPDLEVAPTA